MLFSDEGTGQRYESIYSRLSAAAGLAHARDWLRARDLLTTLPLPQPGKPLSGYAQALEDFCGVPKRSLLVALNDHEMTFAPEALGKVTANGLEKGAVSNEQFECIMNSMTAAELDKHGLSLGFIGNEALATTRKPRRKAPESN